MTVPSSESAAGPSSGRLSRREALAATGAGIATAVAAGLPQRSFAQEATPIAAETLKALDDPGVVTPERVQLAVERVPEIAEDILRRSGVPGMSVAVVYDDTVLYMGGFGVREVGTDEPIDENTVFQLASVSKSVSATVVSSVVADGDISWSSRMADVHSGFALEQAWPSQEVTLADLFSHRSGLLDHAGDILEDLGYSRDDVIHRLRFMPPEYSFRAGYAYTNFGLSAAAYAVAAFVGTPWEDLTRARLYAPLGMDRTSSTFADYMAAGERAIPHVKEGDAWVVTPQQRDPDAQSPAGGVSSTARDLAQWLRLRLSQGMYDGTQLIPAAALAPTEIPQSVSNPPANPATDHTGFYGLGMNVSFTAAGGMQWSHSGAFASGAATAYYMLPGSGLGALALTNGSPTGVPEALCLSVLDIAQHGDLTLDWFDALAALFARMAVPSYGTATDWSTPTADIVAAAAQDAYLGTYENDVFGKVEIVASGDGMDLLIGPEPRVFALAHFDRDTFTWQPTGENAYGLSGLSFTLDGNSMAAAFSDEYLAGEGDGYFTRVDSPPS